MDQNLILNKFFRFLTFFGLTAGLLLNVACVRESEGETASESDGGTFLVDDKGILSMNGVPITLGKDRLSKLGKILDKAPTEIRGVHYWPDSGLSAVQKRGCLQKILVALQPKKTTWTDSDGEKAYLVPFAGEIAVSGVAISDDKSIRELNSVSSVKFTQYGKGRVRYSIPGSDGVSAYIDYGELKGRMSNLQLIVSKDKWSCTPVDD